MSGAGPEAGDRPDGRYAAPPPLGLATTAAAAASTCIFLLWGGPYVAFFAFVIAWLHAVFLGLPLYLRLSRTRPLTEGASIGGGCAVGALPVLLLLGTGIAGSDGWFAAVFAAAIFGFLGALGGAAFWAVMRRHWEPRGLEGGSGDER